MKKIVKAILFLDKIRQSKYFKWSVKLIDFVIDMSVDLFGQNKTTAPKYHTDLVLTSIKDRIDWGIKSAAIPKIWAQTMGEGIKVLVLDSGSPKSHPDLSNAIVKQADFTNSGTKDVDGHSTHVCGIIGARANNTGVIGLAPMCDIYIGKVLDNDGNGNYEWLTAAINWGIKEKVDIINMSLGGPVPYSRMYKAIKRAISKGIIVIAAAGNEGDGVNTIGYPGRYNEVITVGAYNRELVRSRFSSVGKEIDLLAPGEHIYSTFVDGKYASLSGTSMAAPFITGLVALMLAKHRIHGGQTPCTNQKEVFEHLKKITVDKGNRGWDKYYGFGIIDPTQVAKIFEMAGMKSELPKSRS